MLGELLGVPKKNETVLCSSQDKIEAPRVVQDADTAKIVAADAREEDEVLLSRLEAHNCGYLNLLAQLLGEVLSHLPLQVIVNVCTLALVGRDYDELIWSDARLQKCRDDLYDIERFNAIQERGA